MGHKDIRTTFNIYTHVTKNAKKKVAMRFANYMQGSATTDDINLAISNLIYYIQQLEQALIETKDNLPDTFYSDLAGCQDKLNKLQNKELIAI